MHSEHEISGWLPRAGQGRLAAMTEPAPDPDEHVNLHPGQHDEGGQGGMATRELAAREQAEREQDDADD